MAVGDLGASKGLRVIPNTKAINLGYDDLNQKADEIAKEINDRAAAVATRAPLSHIHQYPDIMVDGLTVTAWVTAYFSTKGQTAEVAARTPVIKVQAAPLNSADAVGTLRFW